MTRLPVLQDGAEGAGRRADRYPLQGSADKARLVAVTVVK